MPPQGRPRLQRPSLNLLSSTLSQHVLLIESRAAKFLFRAVRPNNSDRIDARCICQTKMRARIVAAEVARRGIDQSPISFVPTLHGDFGAISIAATQRRIDRPN